MFPWYTVKHAPHRVTHVLRRRTRAPSTATSSRFICSITFCIAKSVVAHAARRCKGGAPPSLAREGACDGVAAGPTFGSRDPAAFMARMSPMDVTHPSPSSSSAVISDGKAASDDWADSIAPAAPRMRDL